MLGNTQVVFVGLLAWAALGERPENRSLVSIPVVFLGVILISGVIGSGAYGDDPALGVVFGVLTGITYALFLLILRQGNTDDRRPAGPLFDATLSGGDVLRARRHRGRRHRLGAGPRGAGVARPARAVLAGARLAPDLGLAPAAARGAHVDRPDAAAGATVFLGAMLLSEAPSAVQLLGVAIVIAGVAVATIRPRERAPAPA